MPGSVESKSGEVVHDPSKVKEEWKNYFKELLNPSADNDSPAIELVLVPINTDACCLALKFG